MTDEVLAKMAVEVDGNNPETNIMALVEVTKNICEATGKGPIEGVMSLMTAAAWLLNAHVEGLAKAAERPVDMEHLIHTYMTMAAQGWNANGFIFRGVPFDHPEIGEVIPDPDEMPDPQDRTRWN